MSDIQEKSITRKKTICSLPNTTPPISAGHPMLTTTRQKEEMQEAAKAGKWSHEQGQEKASPKTKISEVGLSSPKLVGMLPAKYINKMLWWLSVSFPLIRSVGSAWPQLSVFCLLSFFCILSPSFPWGLQEAQWTRHAGKWRLTQLRVQEAEKGFQ